MKKIKVSYGTDKKDQHFQYCGKDIVESVCAGGYAEAAYGVEHGEIDPGQRPEDELAHGERVAPEEASVGKEEMVVGAEEDGRDQHGNKDRIVFLHSQGVLKQHHQQADQDEAENQLFIDAGADAGDDVDHQHPLCHGFDDLLQGDQGGGGRRRHGRAVAVEQEAQDDERDGQKDTFEGHRDEIAEADLPFGLGGDLEAEQDENDDERGGHPGHPGAEMDEFEQILHPNEGHDPHLGLCEGLSERFGVDEEGADLVKEHEAQQVRQGVNGAACSIQI